MTDRIKTFLKNETVLTISFLLAVLSALAVRPDSKYAEYIDFRTLALLLSLMLVVAGAAKLGIFRWIAGRLVNTASDMRQLALILIMLCFVFSMFITNDVSLITFVPLAIEVLTMAHMEQYMIKVIVLQTVAANLGSMLTPIGNPQNLYLYGLSGMGVKDFCLLMLPYTITALAMLVVSVFIFIGKDRLTAETIHSTNGGCEDTVVTDRAALHDTISSAVGIDKSVALVRIRYVMYALLFVLCLLTVARVIPYQALLVIILAAVAAADRDVLGRADYSLLLTFVFLFVFIGNMGRIEAVSSFLSDIIAGHEIITGILASQIMSNVPAAILLSGFGSNIRGLIVGVNLGGLGTLIASMASLISYRFYAGSRESSVSRYMVFFTLVNVIFLAVLYCVSLL